MSQLLVNSFILGSWQESEAPSSLFNSPIDGSKLSIVTHTKKSGEEILAFSRTKGISNLQDLSFHDRAKILKKTALHLEMHKEELYKLSYLTGATLKDSYLDIDGGIGTLLVMASKVRKEIGEGLVKLDGQIETISRNGTFLGQHILSPLNGVALQINAFNFPVWGMLEKLSCSFLAGLPTIVKASATTSFLTKKCVELLLASGFLPEGAIQFIPGPLNNLLDHLVGQDVVSFTGSAQTGYKIRSNSNLIKHSVKFVSEQDSLNACILGADVKESTPEWDLFIKEVITEITSKTGQKCTAIRRIFVPKNKIKIVSESIKEKLEKLRVGDPRDMATDIGPLVSTAQKAAVLSSTSLLLKECNIITGKRNFSAKNKHNGTGFLYPILLVCSNPENAISPHEVEAFGPAATIMGYKNYDQVINLVAKGQGSLVSSIFSNDLKGIKKLALGLAPYNGRIYINNRDSLEESTGHGSPLPHMKHGGPGRAGNGEELGGIRGLNNYLHRTAIQGSPNSISKITNQWIEGSDKLDSITHPFRKNFNSLAIGDTITTNSRVITSEDVEKFANFTGDKFYAHMNEEEAKKNPFFSGRVAHGYLLLSFAAGLFVDPGPGPVLANTGLKDLAFQKPVSPGDKIHVQLTVKSKKRRTETYGEVSWFIKLENQNQDVVAKYELLTMNSYSDLG